MSNKQIIIENYRIAAQLLPKLEALIAVRQQDAEYMNRLHVASDMIFDCAEDLVNREIPGYNEARRDFIVAAVTNMYITKYNLSWFGDEQPDDGGNEE